MRNNDTDNRRTAGDDHIYQNASRRGNCFGESVA
jgi:hypothetical protein